MKQLFMKQKMFSLGEKFSIKDSNGVIIYTVQGSFLKIPKSFSMMNQQGQEVGKVTKQLFKLLPKFTVEVNGREALQIRKELTIFKSKYRIDSKDITIQGDWWNMNFDIYQSSTKIATVKQKWIAMTSTFEMTIFDKNFEQLVVLIVVAIDFVKAEESHSNSSSSND